MREWVWPRAGWRRVAIYYRHRVARIPDTPYRIAAGFACGAAISFTPFVFFHIALSLLLAFIIRANLVAAALGTLVGNPWTFPFIWLGIYQFGSWLLGAEADPSVLGLIGSGKILADPTPILLPATVGGLPMAFLVWWLVYWPMRRVVEQYRKRRARRLERRLRKNV